MQLATVQVSGREEDLQEIGLNLNQMLKKAAEETAKQYFMVKSRTENLTDTFFS